MRYLGRFALESNRRITTVSLYLVFFALLIAVNLVVWTLWNVSLVSHDGIQYLSTAVNYSGGHGFSTNALLYESHYQATLPAPQIVWPPGFPYLISLLISVGFSPHRAALLIVMLAHSGAAISIAAILLRCGVARVFSVLAAVCFLLFLMPWVYVISLSADPLMNFLMLAVLALLPIVEPEKRGSGVVLRLIVCSMLCTVLLLSRYSAILFFAALGCTALFTTGAFASIGSGLVGKTRIQYSMVQLAAMLAIPAAGFLSLLLRNQALTGSYLPNNGENIPLTLLQTIKAFPNSLAGFLGFQNTLLPPAMNKMMFILIILLMGAVVVLALKLLTKPSSYTRIHRTPYVRTIAMVIALHTALFIAYFAYKLMSASFPELIPRYVFQIFGGLYLLFCLIVGWVLQQQKRTPDRKYGMLIMPMLALLFVLVQLGQLNSWTKFKLFESRHRMVTTALASPLSTGQNLEDFIRHCYPNNNTQSALWSNEGQLLHFYTALPTLTLPKGRLSNRYARQRMYSDFKTYDVKMLVLFESELRDNQIHSLATLRNWFVEFGFSALPLNNSVRDSNLRVDVYIADQQCL